MNATQFHPRSQAPTPKPRQWLPVLRRGIKGRNGRRYPSGTPVFVRRIGSRWEIRDQGRAVIRVFGPSKFRRSVELAEA